MHDTLYAAPLDPLPRFCFDEQVADVFPDMINRSVPGYQTIVHNIAMLCRLYAQSGTNCYDLGCSLGTATLAMRRAITAPACTIIAVDSSAAMVRRCRHTIERDNARVGVEVVRCDIRDIPIINASVVVLNFTLQFVPPENRLELLQAVRRGMVDGGIVILAEKVRFRPSCVDQFHDRHHTEFKRFNGYSDLEISQKRTALETVLVRDSIKTHHERLKLAGFASSTLWFQCFNFAALLATA